MGLYQALTRVSNTIPGWLPPGFKPSGEFAWIVRIEKTEGKISTSINKEEFPHLIPKAPPDRTNRKSPTLLIDKASYALGVAETEAQKNVSHEEHLLFRELLQLAQIETAHDSSISMEAKETIDVVSQLDAEMITQLRKTDGLKASDTVVFLVGGNPYAFSDKNLVAWLNDHHYKRLSKKGIQSSCSICSQTAVAGRLSPKAKLFGQRPPLSTFNLKSSQSMGKEQMANAPICHNCASSAEAGLGALVRLDNRSNSGAHCVILAQNEKKEGNGRPLANQLAVFWTEEEVRIETKNELDQSITATEVIRISLDEDDDTPPEQVADTQIQPEARSSQLRNFLESPWYCKSQEIEIFDPIPFYFAILSPNKSRLAIREWIETDVSSVRNNLIVYREALEIIDPVSGETVVPALRALLEALRAPSSKNQKHNEKPRLAEIEPELTRQLVRTMYTGSNPPDALLRRAVQAFAMPDSAKGQSGRRLSRRRTALAAAMKLILTYKHPAERKIMIQQKTKHDEESGYKNESPYLCGQIFAILGEIQRRASSSGRGVNATVVDKFYSTAATAPQSVLGNLLTKASVGHLPKLRKDPAKGFTKPKNEGGVHLADLLTQNVARLDAACGPKPQHTPRQQAEFALGYHHQLAEFRF